MAFINNIYVHVVDESLSRSVDSTTRPVEKGIDLTDHVKLSPASVSISGNIVGKSAANDISKLYALMKSGTLVKYSGRNLFSNAQIINFNTSHPNTVWGGCEFDMEIREVRIAKSGYKPIATTASSSSKKSATSNKSGTGTTVTAAAAATTVKAGNKIILSNTALYVSSTATNVAARKTGTYYLYSATKVSGRYRITDLLSNVGKTPIGHYVTGWVDASVVETSTTSTKASATTKSGTQQTQTNSTSTKVYHTTKKGDTVYSLVSAADAPYKKYGFSANDVMSNNPNAFSVKGQANTLKIGVKLWVGNR